ncbi:hypothetical protein U1Q18_008323 [Sarracenia purpurea var. burkii]
MNLTEMECLVETKEAGGDEGIRQRWRNPADMKESNGDEGIRQRRSAWWRFIDLRGFDDVGVEIILLGRFCREEETSAIDLRWGRRRVRRFGEKVQ